MYWWQNHYALKDRCTNINHWPEGEIESKLRGLNPNRGIIKIPWVDVLFIGYKAVEILFARESLEVTKPLKFEQVGEPLLYLRLKGRAILQDVNDETLSVQTSVSCDYYLGKEKNLIETPYCSILYEDAYLGLAEFDIQFLVTDFRPDYIAKQNGLDYEKLVNNDKEKNRFTELDIEYENNNIKIIL